MSTALAVAVALIVALAIGFALGRTRRPRDALQDAASPPRAAPPPRLGPSSPPVAPSTPEPTTAVANSFGTTDASIAERARIIRAFESETATLRAAIAARDASATHLAAFADDRARLFDELARARAETARYRQLVVDLEDNAPPPLLDTSAPDDLKLIVGIGPVLERMLQQLGITTYRQIARWSERDIDEFDAKLHEFPGRIRRDSWVTQARALHQSKYGETLPVRERW